MYKNIVFDMGGVLFHWNSVTMLKPYDLSEEDKSFIRDELFNSEEWPLTDWGYYTEAEAADIVCRRAPERLHEYIKEMSCRWFNHGIEAVEGMTDILKELKEKGYKLYLLSNAGSTHDEYWPLVPGNEYFDGKVVSAYEKVCKPLPGIYERLLEKFSLKAEECIFIDDLPTNIAGAKLCGIDGIVFRNAQQLRNTLLEKQIL